MRLKANICCISDGDPSSFLSRIKSLEDMDCNISYATDISNLTGNMGGQNPDFFCFYISKASSETLSLFTQVKSIYPSIPALLITHIHSEALAIWALRARVWDYFSEPVDQTEFINTVHALLELRQGNANRESRTPVRRSSIIPEKHLEPETHREKSVRKAIEYLQVNYPEKISQSELATSLGISTAYFSQAFHQITGTSFSEYLLKVRIMSAVKLLGQHNVPVSSVCFEVGFNDHSYFSRVFKRIVGLSPSEYKKSKKKALEYEFNNFD